MSPPLPSPPKCEDPLRSLLEKSKRKRQNVEERFDKSCQEMRESMKIWKPSEPLEPLEPLKQSEPSEPSEPLGSASTSPNPVWKELKLTPSKRSSLDYVFNERDRAKQRIAKRYTTSMRRVWGCKPGVPNFYDKKLKRFEKDSPSSLSRKNEDCQRSPLDTSSVPVVDLCSSDEEESGIEESPQKALTDSFRKKDPPPENKEPTKVSPAAAAAAVSEATPSPSDSKPPVNLSISDKNQNQEELDYSSDQAVCGGETNKTTKKHRSFRTVCGETIKTIDAFGTACGETTKTFDLLCFSLERKRMLLDVLAPATLPPEAMKQENWMLEDAVLVEKAFYQRFGSLESNDLSRLAKGEFFVPKDMVSVKESLRAWRLKTDAETALEVNAKLTPELLTLAGMKDAVLHKAGIAKEAEKNDQSTSNGDFYVDFFVPKDPESVKEAPESTSKAFGAVVSKQGLCENSQGEKHAPWKVFAKKLKQRRSEIISGKRATDSANPEEEKPRHSSHNASMAEEPDSEGERVAENNFAWNGNGGFDLFPNVPLAGEPFSSNIDAVDNSNKDNSWSRVLFNSNTDMFEGQTATKSVAEKTYEVKAKLTPELPAPPGIEGNDPSLGRLATNEYSSLALESHKRDPTIEKDCGQSVAPSQENERKESEEEGRDSTFLFLQSLYNEETSKPKEADGGHESNDACEGTNEASEAKKVDESGSDSDNDTSRPEDEIDNETLEQSDAIQGVIDSEGTIELAKPKDSQEQVEDAVENTIVEYRGDGSSTGNPEERLTAFREARGILRGIMANIVNAVSDQLGQERAQHAGEIEAVNTTQNGQEREQHPGEIEVNIPVDAEANQEQLKLEGSSEGDFSVMSGDGEEEEQEENDRALIAVSAKQLLLLALPLVCLAVIVRRLGLLDVSNSILEGCFRTFLQLHVLGSLLSPIFKYGSKHPVLVGCYALFMIVLASYEASSRTKYTHDGQLPIIVQSLVLNVGWVALWAFGAILKPRPVWNPRYLLPIIGMLLGNSINGISITLDTITTSLVEKQAEIDLYLSFGANQYEAMSGIVAHAIQKGTTPSLNMMCVVGIVSIPGMMTGQILGGSSPMVAARYQAMIIFLIALSAISTILVSSCLTVMSAFCSHQILRPERFVKNRKRGLARLILWVWGYVFGRGSDNMIPLGSKGISNGNDGGFLLKEALETNSCPSSKSFDIRPLKKGSVVSDGEGLNSLVQADGLYRYFYDHGGTDEHSDNHRVLFSNLSLSVNEGDLLLVSGPSGTGKSQLLRMMAGLSPMQGGTLRLQGRSWKDDFSGNNAVEWRRQIRYVTQTKVQIPGTPLQFIKKIQSFRSWKSADDRMNSMTDYDVMKHVSHHIRQWGMSLESLDKEWSVLSGGESQRVLMAIALASRPKLLLFDESTSALDQKSKLAVETSIKDFVEDHEGGVLWVSHDEQQAERMMDDSESVGVSAN